MTRIATGDIHMDYVATEDSKDPNHQKGSLPLAMWIEEVQVDNQRRFVANHSY